METIKLFNKKSELLAMFDPKDQARANWRGEGWYYMLPDYTWHGSYLTKEMAKAWQDGELDPSDPISLSLRIYQCQHWLVEEIDKILTGCSRGIYDVGTTLDKIESAQSVLRHRIKDMILKTTCGVEWKIVKLLDIGLTIEAVKLYREVFGGDLLGAKRAVEAIRERTRRI